jgi:hypothetical protein
MTCLRTQGIAGVTDKKILVCLSVILADGDLNIFVVRSALLLYIVAHLRGTTTDARKTG